MSKNILITAIGSFSVPTVINSLIKDKRFDKIYGCDIYPKDWHHISKKFDEVFLAPYVTEEEKYLQFIQNLVKEKQINIIIPSTDIEVDFFNKNRHLFDNVIITIGSSSFLEIARNKKIMSKFLNDNDLYVPKTYVYNELANALFPLIAKPQNGRSSEGVFLIDNIEELPFTKSFDNYIFQEFINGEIITVDMLNDGEKDIFIAVPRKELLRTSNGAGLTVEMFYDENLQLLAKLISNKIGATGAYNMEFILKDRNYYLIDINPRFSAGIGFTHKLNYNYVENTLNYYLGDIVNPEIIFKNMILQKEMHEVVNKIIL